MATHSGILARKIPGQRSLAGYSPWCHTESDMTEQLSMPLSHNLFTGNSGSVCLSCKRESEFSL